MSKYNDNVISTLVDLIENHDNEEISKKLWNEYASDRGEAEIYGMEDFEDFCERNVSYSEVAEAARDRDVNIDHAYFRYDGSFDSSDDVCSLVASYEWEQAVEDILDGISLEEFCDEYEIDYDFREEFINYVMSDLDIDISAEKARNIALKISIEEITTTEWNALWEKYGKVSLYDRITEILDQYHLLDLENSSVASALGEVTTIASEMADLLKECAEKVKED